MPATILKGGATVDESGNESEYAQEVPVSEGDIIFQFIMGYLVHQAGGHIDVQWDDVVASMEKFAGVKTEHIGTKDAPALRLTLVTLKEAEQLDAQYRASQIPGQGKLVN